MSDVLALQMQWPALAQDIALITIPNSPVTNIDAVCNTYGITRAALKELLQVPHFQLLLDASMQELRKQGSRAGARYRAMQLSQSLAENLYRKANSGRLEDKEAVKLLDILVKAAGMAKDEPQTQVNVQTNVALPFPPGVKKVEQFVQAVSE